MRCESRAQAKGVTTAQGWCRGKKLESCKVTAFGSGDCEAPGPERAPLDTGSHGEVRTADPKLLATVIFTCRAKKP